MDDDAAKRNAAQLDELIADTSALSATLKRRVKALEKQGGSGRDGQIRKQQVKFVGTVDYLRVTEHITLLCFRRPWSSLNSWRPFKATRLSSSSTAQNTSNGWRDNSKLVRCVSV